jgi:hypothetical protein
MQEAVDVSTGSVTIIGYQSLNFNQPLETADQSYRVWVGTIFGGQFLCVPGWKTALAAGVVRISSARIY